MVGGVLRFFVSVALVSLARLTVVPLGGGGSQSGGRALLVCRLLLGAAFLLSLPSAATAQYPLPGWLRGDGRAGVALAGATPRFSAPAVADLAPDSPGLEVTVGGADGRLYVYRSDGTLLWERDTPSAGCSASSTNRLLSSPAVGDLDGDGDLEVVIGFGGVGLGRGCPGGVAAFGGSSGAEVFVFNTSRFARGRFTQVPGTSVVSTPALADTDGDGRMEIGFGAFDRSVYLLNSNGSVRWYYEAADTVWSSGAFADADGDGVLEFIIGTDISRNTRLVPPTRNGGMVYAFRTGAVAGKRIRFRDRRHYLWARYLDQVVFSSPVIAEVLPANPGREVIVGSGCFFPIGAAKKRGRWFKVLSLRTGRVLRTLPIAVCSSSSAGVGDLDGDGFAEVVVQVNGDLAPGGDPSGALVAWNPRSGGEVWRRPVSDPEFGNLRGPVVADLDGNGSVEVIAAVSNAVRLFSGLDGAPLGVLSTAGRVLATPAVGDLNGDGAPEVIAGGGTSRGVLYVWTGFTGTLGSPPGTGIPFAAPWPCARGAPSRRGGAADPA